MTKTASRAALLRIAMQDLRAGAAMLAERVPTLIDAASAPALRVLLTRTKDEARAQEARLEELGAAGGPENLWMAGILDDAERDATSHLPGEILDVALIGAVRKAKAAEIVSLTTAIVLARRDVPANAPPLALAQEEAVATDQVLVALLEELVPPAKD